MEQKIRKGKLKFLPLNKIVFDKKFYPRQQVVYQTKIRYWYAMQSGAQFPPICVALREKKYILVDGAHRLEAKKLNKEKHTQVEVLTGLSDKEIFQEAVNRNVINGQPFSAYEVTAIIQQLQKYGIKREEISSIIKIPVDRITPFIVKRIVRITETNDEKPLRREFLHLADTDISLSDNEELGNSIGHSQEAILDEVILLFERRLFDTTNKSVVRKIEKLKKILADFVYVSA